MDKLVHKLAFASPTLQIAISDIEDSLFPRITHAADPERPVFVTSLPRAGTTIVLEALAAQPQLISHTYRDMPFIMSPVLWAKISSPFQKRAALSERAHGDGIEVGYDSPEAFEEVFWRAFWPEHYGPDFIRRWQADDLEEDATAFLKRHMNKLLALRAKDPVGTRYLSKNNANIARIDLLRTMFPSARIIVPIRHPVSHALSLMRQHDNFNRQHREDQFVRRYMSDIGHFEFGDLHRPIRFENFKEESDSLSPRDPDYWLLYWLAANRELMKQRSSIHTICFERLCDRDENEIARLIAAADLPASSVSDISGFFKKRVVRQADNQAFSKPLVDEALALYSDLTAI